MRVFVAGGTGVLGRRLVPQLVMGLGHQVTATTTSAAKLGLLEQLGAEAVVIDGLDAMSVGQAVAAARPDAIVHQMTGISLAHAGKFDIEAHGSGGSPPPIGCAPRGRITCWPRTKRPAGPRSWRRASAALTARARVDG